MLENYDFSKAIKNPFARIFNETITTEEEIAAHSEKMPNLSEILQELTANCCEND